jgi:hypothetical protein
VEITDEPAGEECVMREQALVSVAGTIELRVQSISQLFCILDSYPFRERGLSPEAERYLVEHAADLPKDRQIAIVAHVEEGGDVQADAANLTHAVGARFATQAKTETRELEALFRDGGRALMIGLTILGICLFLGWQLSLNFEGALSRILGESFVIIGWVVIWRPAEMFLYDWVPIVRRRTLFRRLAAATVTVKVDGPLL